MNQEIKQCQNCKQQFIIEPEDFKFYEKMKVPPPTFCPDCRFQRRLSFRNNRVFYRTQCAMCGKSILSLYERGGNFTVYCRTCWLSDKWDPISYGRDYDFSKPFFNQFRLLQYSVPRANMFQTNFHSSEYCNYGLDFKECYLMFGGYNNERVYFGNQIINSYDSLDIAFSEQVEFSYELLECQRANRLFFSHHCEDCIESYYLIDCRNCSNCFGCFGLRNKQYHIFNKPYTKEDYKQFINSGNIGSFSGHIKFLENLRALELSQPHQYARIYKSVNSSGDDLYEAKNTRVAFTSRNVEDSKYLFLLRYNTKDCYDVSFQGFNVERIYEITNGFGGSDIAFGVRNHSNQRSRYNEECHDSANIFGCIGLRHKKYCILNKQYSREEYEKMVPRIIEHMNEKPYISKVTNHRTQSTNKTQNTNSKTQTREIVYRYGEFFPPELSPFSYNETIAQEYFPLTKEQAIERGYQWKDPEPRNYEIQIQNGQLPDHIKDAGDDVIDKIIECRHQGKCQEQCTEVFKIIEPEFQFYKKFNLPLPRFCPNCRHYQRIKQRNPLKLWHRQCQCTGKTSDPSTRRFAPRSGNNAYVYQNTAQHFHQDNPCPNEFETTYAPERKEIVYCGACYLAEVV